MVSHRNVVNYLHGLSSEGVAYSLTKQYYPWCETYILDGLEIHVPFDI